MALFNGMKFECCGISHRELKEITQLVEANGGTVGIVDFPLIFMPRACYTPGMYQREQVYDIEFIKTCVEKGKLVDLRDFRLGPKNPLERFVMCYFLTRRRKYRRLMEMFLKYMEDSNSSSSEDESHIPAKIRRTSQPSTTCIHQKNLETAQPDRLDDTAQKVAAVETSNDEPSTMLNPPEVNMNDADKPEESIVRIEGLVPRIVLTRLASPKRTPPVAQTPKKSRWIVPNESWKRNDNVASGLDEESGFVERDNEIVALLRTCPASDDENIASSGTSAANDNAKIALLKTSAANDNRKIAALKTSASQDNAKIALLNTSAADDNRKIALPKTSVANDNAKIASLKTSAAKDNAKIAAPKTSASHDNAKIAALKTSAANDNRKIAAPKTSAANDNAKIALLKTSAADDNRKIAAPKTSVADDNRKIAAPKTSAANDTEKIATLKTSAANDNRKIAAPKTSAANDNGKIATPRTTAANDNGKIATPRTTAANDNGKIVTPRASAANTNEKIAEPKTSAANSDYRANSGNSYLRRNPLFGLRAIGKSLKNLGSKSGANENALTTDGSAIAPDATASRGEKVLPEIVECSSGGDDDDDQPTVLEFARIPSNEESCAFETASRDANQAAPNVLSQINPIVNEQKIRPGPSGVSTQRRRRRIISSDDDEDERRENRLSLSGSVMTLPRVLETSVHESLQEIDERERKNLYHREWRGKLESGLPPKPIEKKQGKFTQSERNQMVKYLCEHKHFWEIHPKGLKIWNNMLQSGLLSNRTPKSLQNHFSTSILPSIEDYSDIMTEKQLEHFVKIVRTKRV